MRPHTAYTAFIVIAFLLILTPITLWLHQGSVDSKMALSFVLIAVFIALLARWMYRKTGIVRVVRPYRYLGVGTTIFVIGILLIFVVITLLLMGYEFTDPLQVGLQSDPISLPGFHKLIPVIGVLLMLFGLWLNQSDKYYIRLAEH